MSRRAIRRCVLVGVLALPALMLACTVTVPWGAAAVRTARLMPAFFAALSADPSTWRAGAVATETVELASGPDGAWLHVWRPATGRHPALVVSLGVDPAPPDDPRVARLFTGLAHAGLVAVLVESAALTDDRITPAAPELIVRTVAQVAGWPAVRDGRVGLFGFSVGAAMVELAAADPRIQDRVAVVGGFGGYADLLAVAAAATTGTLRDGGRTEPWAPDAVTVTVMRKNLIAGVPAAADRDALWHALVDHTALLAPADALTPAGRAVRDLLTNTDPARVDALLAALPAPQRAELAALSPVHVLGRVHAPVYLMHDRGDPLLPYVESRRARDALVAAGRPQGEQAAAAAAGGGPGGQG